jgi:hypothetical protein
VADFDELDRILGIADAGENLATRTTAITPERPWIEDQGAANDAVFEMYEKLGLKKPKPVWAKSPRVIHEAIEMIRNIHVGQRHNAIEALVPYNDDVLRREAQKTLLEAIIDRDLTVTMGGCLSKQFPYNRRNDLGRLPGYFIHALQPLNLGRQTAPAGWADAVLYSAGLPSMILQSQTFCILPYVKIAWMCSPGKKLVDDVNTVWTWGDGYTVVIKHEEPKEEDEARPTLEGGTYGEIDRNKFGDPTTPTIKSTPRLLEGK